MKLLRVFAAALLVLCSALPALRALEKQPSSAYHARRVALAGKLQGGVAVLFAAEESVLDFMPYRQDSDFYYLTGWTEPGAALLIVGDAPQAASPRSYKEILFLPARNLRMETYTGAKMDASTPGVTQAVGVDAVEPMTELPAELSRLIAADRALAKNVWTQPDIGRGHGADQLYRGHSGHGRGAAAARRDQSDHASAPDQGRRRDRADQKSVVGVDAGAARDDAVVGEAGHDGARRRRSHDGRVDGERMRAAELRAHCGIGINSTTLHYSANDRTMQDGDILLVDAACEYSMYAADITRTVPVNGHFTARQREIYNIVLGAQKAAIKAFVPGKSTINDRDRQDPNSLDNAAYNYINTHGKDLHGEPLGKVLAAWAGTHDGNRRARPGRLSAGAQAGNGLHH